MAGLYFCGIMAVAHSLPAEFWYIAGCKAPMMCEGSGEFWKP